jgi:hypothetical protein
VNLPSLIVVIGSVPTGMYVLHRLALWAEERGWIYYLKKKARPDTLGNAFLELQSMVQPEKKYAIEARQEKAEREDQCGPDAAGSPADAN